MPDHADRNSEALDLGDTTGILELEVRHARCSVERRASATDHEHPGRLLTESAQRVYERAGRLSRDAHRGIVGIRIHSSHGADNDLMTCDYLEDRAGIRNVSLNDGESLVARRDARRRLLRFA